MADNNQEEASTQPEATGDKQSMLLKLAERTVVQAEALAQEITDHAKQEAEAAGAKIIADASEKAKAEAQQTIDSAKRRSETVTSEAAAEAAAEALSESEKTLNSARSESEKMLSKAQSDSDKLVSKAKEESDKLLNKAKSDSEANVGSANSEVQEILGKARQEAQGIIKASQTRADSTESNARLEAEFFIRKTTQSVTDEIRASVMEICNNLLPTVEEFGKSSTAEALSADDGDSPVATETPMLESADADDGHSAATNGVESGKPKAKAPKKSLAA